MCSENYSGIVIAANKIEVIAKLKASTEIVVYVYLSSGISFQRCMEAPQQRAANIVEHNPTTTSDTFIPEYYTLIASKIGSEVVYILSCKAPSGALKIAEAKSATVNVTFARMSPKNVELSRQVMCFKLFSELSKAFVRQRVIITQLNGNVLIPIKTARKATVIKIACKM